MLRDKVVLHRTDEGISVSVPGLPGCWSQGDTEEEALANIQVALAALEDLFRGAEFRSSRSRWAGSPEMPA
jgi:predicted RNase H-like HicB family nuclease